MAEQTKKDEHVSTHPISQAFAWVESAASVGFAIRILMGLCAALLVLDIIIHRHSYAPGEGLFGFYCAVGFVAFLLIVLGAKKLRTWIFRDETYYAPRSVDSEAYPIDQLEIMNDQQSHAPSKEEGRAS